MKYREYYIKFKVPHDKLDTELTDECRRELEVAYNRIYDIMKKMDHERSITGPYTYKDSEEL